MNGEQHVEIGGRGPIRRNGTEKNESGTARAGQPGPGRAEEAGSEKARTGNTRAERGEVLKLSDFSLLNDEQRLVAWVQSRALAATCHIPMPKGVLRMQGHPRKKGRAEWRGTAVPIHLLWLSKVGTEGKPGELVSRRALKRFLKLSAA